MACGSEYERIFTEFSRLTGQGMALDDALSQSCKGADRETAEAFARDCREDTARTVKALADIVRRQGGDMRRAVDRQKLPRYMQEDLLKALGLPLQAPPVVKDSLTAAKEGKADFKTLEKYIDAGFELYPCVSSLQKGEVKYLPITLTGKLKLYESEEMKAKHERHGITDKRILESLCEQRGVIVDEYGKPRKIELFRIFPIDNNFIVIDIDTHKDKANGLMQWHQYIEKNGLGGVPYYRDLKAFPCHVVSANGGIHLYFKCPYSLPEKIINLASSVEVSSKDHGETAGGSFRKDTKNGFYILHGRFEDAPLLPVCIYNDMKEKPKPMIQKTQYRAMGYINNKTSWKELPPPTPQECIDKGKSFSGNGGKHVMFSRVIGCFSGFYKKTQEETLDAFACKQAILQDLDYLAWTDNDKEDQIDKMISKFYGE